MESTSEQAAEGKAVVTVLAAVLERLVKSNAHTNKNRVDGSVPEVTKFHALKAPGISIKQYLERIHKYASCSTECFVLALIYIDRLIQNTNFVLSDLNVHRVVITAILLAAKFFDDAYYNNAYYAKVGGVLVSEMNSLEVEFLFRINFSLHVKPEVFEKYQDELVSHAVGAGLESQQQQQELHYDPKAQVPCNVVPQSQVHMQPQNSTISQPMFHPIPVVNGPTQTVIPSTHSEIVGNVTPSPPQNNMDYNQQQNPQISQNVYFVPMNQQQSQQAPQYNQYSQGQQHQHQTQQLPHHPPNNYFEPYPPQQNIQHHDQQQQQYHPTHLSNSFPEKVMQKPKMNPTLNPNQIISSTKDVIFATCCPYGGRLTPNSSASGILNTATRIYQ